MRELAEGEPIGSVIQAHMDRCLGCMACMTACPSGVQYDKLIEATRVEVERDTTRTLADQLLRQAIFQLFPFPRRLHVAMVPLRWYQRSGLQAWLHRRRVFERLPAMLGTLEALAPRITRYERLPRMMRACGEQRGVVALLTGCVQSAFSRRSMPPLHGCSPPRVSTS